MASAAVLWAIHSEQADEAQLAHALDALDAAKTQALKEIDS